jgi:hypothetical protein
VKASLPSAPVACRTCSTGSATGPRRAAQPGGLGTANQDTPSRISELAAQLSQELARFGPLDQ